MKIMPHKPQYKSTIDSYLFLIFILGISFMIIGSLIPFWGDNLNNIGNYSSKSGNLFNLFLYNFGFSSYNGLGLIYSSLFISLIIINLGISFFLFKTYYRSDIYSLAMYNNFLKYSRIYISFTIVCLFYSLIVAYESESGSGFYYNPNYALTFIPGKIPFIGFWVYLVGLMVLLLATGIMAIDITKVKKHALYNEIIYLLPQIQENSEVSIDKFTKVLKSTYKEIEDVLITIIALNKNLGQYLKIEKIFIKYEDSNYLIDALINSINPKNIHE